MNNPCMTCGACCAYFRVSFYWAEAEPYGPVPANLTTPVTPHRLAMCGTNQSRPRCQALLGDVGNAVRCTIYEQRPEPCRQLQPSWSAGQADEQCDKARIAWGLSPLSPPDPNPQTSEPALPCVA
ncbi:MAG: YkgJ family cysteine cluster protein [Gammaproteobacteria bacterium]